MGGGKRGKVQISIEEAREIDPRYEVGDIVEYQVKPVVAAFDIDTRKVGKSIDEAIFAKPNCTTIFQEEIPKYDVKVSKIS